MNLTLDVLWFARCRQLRMPLLIGKRAEAVLHLGATPDM